MGLKVIDKGWKAILKAAKAVDGKAIAVGIDESARYEDGTPVALVGYVHENGIGVPSRPFMTELHDKTRDTQDKVSRDVAALDSPAQIAREMERGANELEREYKDKFHTLKLKPLAETTISRKGSAQVLVETGDLSASFKGKVVEAGDAAG